MDIPTDATLTGLDALAEEGFASFGDLRLGLVCNHTAISREREHLLDLLLAHGGKVVALFSPEHGFQGKLDEPVSSTVHEPTGLPIHSLYGSQQKPTPEMLAGVEALVYDIADVGVRFYTYTTTMTHCLAAAAAAGIAMWVLDRPNPIRGDLVEGPILDQPFSRLSAYHPLPLRHGLTSAELAAWANDRYQIDGDLHVIPCRNWRREQWFHETGLPWVNPSPNIRNVREAVLYPAIGTLEACDLSVGRGTDTPFEVFGAPWVDDRLLAGELNRAGIAEMAFVPVEFTPAEREFAGQECRGVYVVLGDWAKFRPVQAAVQIALTLRRLWPEEFDHPKLSHLLGSKKAVEQIGELRPAGEIIAGWEAQLRGYAQEREPYLLYS